MSVIIDTFEIVAHKRNDAKDGARESSESNVKTQPRPVDIEAVNTHQYRRSQRLRAH